MAITIRAAADDDIDAIIRLQREADDTRIVSHDGYLHHRSTRPAAAKILELVATDDGRVVAQGISGLNQNTSTPDAAWAYVAVTPERRREGIGSALTEPLMEHLAAIGAGRLTVFMRWTAEGERWATARGWSRVITAPLIALEPRVVPPPELPDGFSCVAMSELTPEAVYQTMVEAALDEPSAEPNDSISLDEFRRDWNDPDMDLASSAAVLHEGRVAAFAFIQAVGDRAQHGFTGTAAAYRGQGLATAAKRAALNAAAARGVTRVTTSNAEQNAPMRAINRRLGFEQIGEHVILARDLQPSVSS
jgi:ribosomal protein S18 acetylase RimI-like enzyme